MNYFFIALLFFIGLSLAKVYFIFIVWQQENKFREHIFHMSNPIGEFTKNVLFPLSSIYFDMYVPFKKAYKLSEFFGGILFLLLALSLQRVYSTIPNDETIEILLHFLIFIFSVATLLYIAIYDIIYLEIPTKAIIRNLLLFIGIQGIVSVAKAIGIVHSSLFSSIGTVQNIIGFLILYFLTYALIIGTKEQGIGSGDADINGFVGLMLGIPISFIFLLLTIFTGAIVGLIYAGIIGKIKGVLIPMVPLICLGYTISIGFGTTILDFILAV